VILSHRTWHGAMIWYPGKETQALSSKQPRRVISEIRPLNPVLTNRSCPRIYLCSPFCADLFLARRIFDRVRRPTCPWHCKKDLVNIGAAAQHRCGPTVAVCVRRFERNIPAWAGWSGRSLRGPHMAMSVRFLSHGLFRNVARLNYATRQLVACRNHVAFRGRDARCLEVRSAQDDVQDCI
jgi:hypothetical protein